MMIIDAICRSLAGRPELFPIPGPRSVAVVLPAGPYEVSVADFEEDDDDPIGDDPLGDFDRPAVVVDHATLLDDALAAMAACPAIRDDVRGLTTDGDHNDCEAIFRYHGEPTILKVRPRPSRRAS